MQEYIAIVPLVVYVASLITSFLMRPVNRVIGRKVNEHRFYIQLFVFEWELKLIINCVTLLLIWNKHSSPTKLYTDENVAYNN